MSTEASLLASNKLFELAGTRATLEDHNLDRHWRNARTHTLHDPVRWKYHAIGNYCLNGIPPHATARAKVLGLELGTGNVGRISP